MQKVAWATITVNSVSLIPNTWVKVLFNARPVTIPVPDAGVTVAHDRDPGAAVRGLEVFS